jgi:hypothetical protein
MRTSWKLALSAAVVASSALPGLALGQGPPAAGWSSLVPRTEGAAHRYAAPDGRAGNPGTREAPWDLASALDGRHKVAPGDVIWVRGGEYRGRFEVKLAGKPGAPVIVRAYPGERATVLDSRVDVLKPATHVWLWGLELAGTTPIGQRQTKQTGSFPNDLPPGGGLDVHAGEQNRFVNLVIHDNVGNGIGWWKESPGGEVHGCLIYRNGWHAPDRNHGHCIYTQNEGDVKTISGCVLSVALEVGSHAMHAYGSDRAYVDNYLIEDNIVYGKGPFLVGGGRPSHGIRVLRNYLYGVAMRLGYGADNEDCEVRDNVIAPSALTARGTLMIQKFKTVVNEGNVQELPEWRAVLIPNKYDPGRAHLAVYNGARAAEVAADVSAFLKPGDSYRLMDSQDVFGKSVSEGRCGGATITVPMKGEFAAFVVLKGEGR